MHTEFLASLFQPKKHLTLWKGYWAQLSRLLTGIKYIDFIKLQKKINGESELPKRKGLNSALTILRSVFLTVCLKVGSPSTAYINGIDLTWAAAESARGHTNWWLGNNGSICRDTACRHFLIWLLDAYPRVRKATVYLIEQSVFYHPQTTLLQKQMQRSCTQK